VIMDLGQTQLELPVGISNQLEFLPINAGANGKPSYY
jgi:hypothetical protein